MEMSTLYTKIPKELDGQIEELAKEKGMKKTDLARELLENGFKADGLISEAEDMKEQISDGEKVKEANVELRQKIDALEEELRSQPAPVPEPRRLTKEEIIQHLQTCKDPHCQYSVIAEAVRDLDKMLKPDLEKGIIEVGDKTFTLEQIPEAKKLFKESYEEAVVIYRKGRYSSPPFRGYFAVNSDDAFEYRLKEAQEEAKKLEEAQKR
jgi:hypothetical protein